MKPISILAIGAHPGDPLDESAATLAKHARRGDDVTMVAITHGAAFSQMIMYTRDQTPAAIKKAKSSLEEVKKVREKEFSNAAKILGVKCRIMGVEDPLMFEKKTLLAVVDLIRELRPTVILTMSPHNIGHPDHSVASELVWRAAMLAEEAGIVTEHEPYKIDCRKVYFSTNDVPERDARPDYLVDVSDTANLRVDALFCLKTQYPRDEHRKWLELIHRDIGMSALAREGEDYGMETSIKYAEAFQHAFKRLPVDYIPS